MASGTQYTATGGLADSSQVREGLDKKKARLLQELEELKQAEEELRREEEVRDLECQVEAARKRVREAPGTRTTAGHSHAYDSHAPDDSAVSASSPNVHASSSYRPSTNGLTNTELFRVEPEMVTSLHDMSNEDLCSFAELHEDPVNDVQIELYVFTYFLLFTRTFSMGYLKQAIQRTEGWIEVARLDHPDRARRFQIFDMMSARMCELTYIPKELLPIVIGER